MFSGFEAFLNVRWRYVAGDLSATVLAGAVSGWLAGLAVGPGWNMWFAMLAMMALGMLAALLLWVPFSIRLGAMEAMVPMMLAGMVSGMVVGMGGAMRAMSAAETMTTGALCGFASMLFVWLMNACLCGVRIYR